MSRDAFPAPSPTDYYGELVAHPDPARAVGWESAAAQAARFEVVRRFVRPGDRVLDLGAGLGDLGRHLQMHAWSGDYLGLRARRARSSPRARARFECCPAARRFPSRTGRFRRGRGGHRGARRRSLAALRTRSRFVRARRLIEVVRPRRRAPASSSCSIKTASKPTRSSAKSQRSAACAWPSSPGSRPTPRSCRCCRSTWRWCSAARRFGYRSWLREVSRFRSIDG